MKLFLALIAACSIRVFAEVPGTVKGFVGEQGSAIPIPGANVSFEGTSYGAVTDPEGHFRVTGIPSGLYSLRVSYVGYAVVRRQVDVRPDEEVELTILLAPQPIVGQPITVTAMTGKERVTPATFDGLERDEIGDRYTVQDIPVLLSDLPSSTYYSESGSGIGYSYLTIRGFDARRVAVMVNGIPQNDPEDHNVYWPDLPDIASSLEGIQVQRGAGSAFYGPPAIGGSVNLVTQSFAREFSIRLSGGYGSYNTRRYGLSFSSGLLGGMYAIHARLSRIESDGYRDRAWSDFKSYFFGAVRYDPDMTTQINVYGGPIADGLAFYGVPKTYVTDRSRRRTNPITRPEEIENFSQPHYELLHEWRVSPSVILNNTLFYVTGDGFFDYDGSWAPYSYYRITPEYGFEIAGDPDTMFIPGALIRAQVSNRQLGWLPRVTWNHGSGEFVAGAELRVHRSEHWGRLQWFDRSAVDVPYDYRYYEYKGSKDMVSVYAREMLGLAPDLTLMLNLQYAHSTYRLFDEKFVGTEFSVPYTFVNPRVGLNYNLSETWNAYVSVAYTSREPRLKNLYDAAESSTPVYPQFEVDAAGRYDYSAPLVGPEALLNLELGGGFRSEGAALTANFYWMDFRDEIVKSGRVDRFGQPVTGNADRTRHFGLEVTGRLAIAGPVELSGNATISRNYFVRHTDFSTGFPVPLDGNPIAGFPDVLGNLRLTYRPGNLLVSISGKFVGRQYTDNLRNAANTVDPYFTSDALVAYTLRDITGGLEAEIKLQVNNIFDALYAQYGEGDQFFVGAERNAFLNVAVGF